MSYLLSTVGSGLELSQGIGNPSASFNPDSWRLALLIDDIRSH